PGHYDATVSANGHGPRLVVVAPCRAHVGDGVSVVAEGRIKPPVAEKSNDEEARRDPTLKPPGHDDPTVALQGQLRVTARRKLERCVANARRSERRVWITSGRQLRNREENAVAARDRRS